MPPEIRILAHQGRIDHRGRNLIERHPETELLVARERQAEQVSIAIVNRARENPDRFTSVGSRVRPRAIQLAKYEQRRPPLL